MNTGAGLAWGFRILCVAVAIAAAVQHHWTVLQWTFIALVQHERAELLRRRFVVGL